jgi:hypothetical protein
MHSRRLRPAVIAGEVRQRIVDACNWLVADRFLAEGQRCPKKTPFRTLSARFEPATRRQRRNWFGSYEPAIRLAARIRLADSRLRRLFDSMDISQAVFASFFVRAALGQYELDRPIAVTKRLGWLAPRCLSERSCPAFPFPIFAPKEDAHVFAFSPSETPSNAAA